MEMENICELSIDSLEEDRLSDYERDQFNPKELLRPNYLSAVNISNLESKSFTCIQRRHTVTEEKHRNSKAVSPSVKSINGASIVNLSPDHSKGATHCHEMITLKSTGEINVTPPVSKVDVKCKNITSPNFLQTKNASYLQMFQEKIRMKDLETIGKNKHKSALSSTKSTRSSSLSSFSAKTPSDVGRDDISSCEHCSVSCSTEGRSYQDKKNHMPCRDESPLLSRLKSVHSNNIPSPKMNLPLETCTNSANIGQNPNSISLKNSCIDMKKKSSISNKNREKALLTTQIVSLGSGYATNHEKLESYLKRCSYGNSVSAMNRVMLLSKINSQKNFEKKTLPKNLSPSEKYEQKNTIVFNRFKQKNSQKISGIDHKNQSNLDLKILQERHQREVLLAKQIKLEVFKNC